LHLSRADSAQINFLTSQNCVQTLPGRTLRLAGARERPRTIS
jgi:hypothetical protein